MTLRSRLLALAVVSSLNAVVLAQEGAKPPEQVPLPSRPVLELKDEIKPLVPVAIPDEPPPHEGAFFDLPITVEPPDIIIVEILEALPGRPITGERLVRPDGTISLGFYGDVHVRGLTLEQVKVRVILHLRKFLGDEILGLLRSESRVEVIPEENKEARPVEEKEKPKPEVKPAVEPAGRPSARLPRDRRSSRQVARRGFASSSSPIRVVAKRQVPAQDEKPVQKPGAEVIVVEEVMVDEKWVVVPPAESSRVFVDFAAYNSKQYYVQGDVGVPGRIAFTGKETVLDALNYAGGMIPTAEPADIHLYRPATGGKPAKDYKIDLDAIHLGVATANLQVFPNDRLIVARNPIVKKTVEIDRVNALLSSAAATSRDTLIKDWAEFLWSITSSGNGAMLDEKAFKEALMKKLSQTPGSK